MVSVLRSTAWTRSLAAAGPWRSSRSRTTIAPDGASGASKSAERVARVVRVGIVVLRGRSAAAVVAGRCSRSTARGAAEALAVDRGRPREKAAVVAPSGDSRIGAPGRSLRGVAERLVLRLNPARTAPAWPLGHAQASSR